MTNEITFYFSEPLALCHSEWGEKSCFWSAKRTAKNLIFDEIILKM